MTKVKVFVYGRRRQKRRRRQRRPGYDNSSPDFRHGELKITQHVFRRLKTHLSSSLLLFLNILVSVTASCP